jgi:hypothetical protein
VTASRTNSVGVSIRNPCVASTRMYHHWLTFPWFVPAKCCADRCCDSDGAATWIGTLGHVRLRSLGRFLNDLPLHHSASLRPVYPVAPTDVRI